MEGNKITKEFEKHIPFRRDLVDQKMAAHMTDLIRREEPILFLPNTYAEEPPSHAKFSTDDYEIHLFGISPCGHKVCVRLCNIDVYVDVLVPADITPDKLKISLSAIIDTQGLSKYMRKNAFETVKLRPFHGFSIEPKDTVRVFFRNTIGRSMFLNILQQEKRELETFNDDPSSKYFNVVARQRKFNTSKWNIISHYTLSKNSAPGCEYTFLVNVADFKKIGNKALAGYKNDPIYSSIIDKDPLLVCSWDIETYSPSGLVPEVGTEYTIFVVGLSFFKRYTDEKLFNIVLTTVDADPLDVGTLCVCQSEQELVQTFLLTMSRLRPDIMIAFNGGNFDWCLMVDKIKKYGLIADAYKAMSSIEIKPYQIKTEQAKEKFAENVSRFNFRIEVVDTSATRGQKKFNNRNSVKIDAETNHTLRCIASFPGMLDIDALPVFLQLYPRTEVPKRASLAWFLAENKLDAKEHMPIKRMFRIYERAMKLKNTKCHCSELANCCGEHVRELDYVPCGTDAFSEDLHPEITKINPDTGHNYCCFCSKKSRNLVDMRDVAYYCHIDCIRPQQLFVKRNIIAEKRELGTFSYVSLYDAFYLANGMKVRNAVGATCFKYNIGYSTRKRTEEKDHYPGALVFPPIRGLNIVRPVVGCDAMSLYPSLVRVFNMSPDMCVKSPEEAERLKNMGYDLHHVENFTYEVGPKKGAATNKSKSAEGWFVRHNGVDDKHDMIIESYVPTESGKLAPIRGRKALPGERMGVFAILLTKLFNKREPMKAEFNRLEELVEKLRGSGAPKDQIASVVYQMNVMKSKQQAIKVLANTFYGESGNNLSGMYELLIAAGITAAGRTFLRTMAEFVSSLGYKLQYGDTDSLYIICPDELFAKCDAEYFAGKITKTEYWTEMVRLTMDDMKQLNAAISNKLTEINGTQILNMAYEEVGMPTVFCGKKKYFMHPHKTEIHFDKPQIFIRGIDSIKQGHAKITKELSNEFMMTILDIKNTESPLIIAKHLIMGVYTRVYSQAVTSFIGEFALSARYSPMKKNQSVLTMIRRMRFRLAIANGENLDQFRNDEFDRLGFAIGEVDMTPQMIAAHVIPDPSDRFEYVVVLREQKYTMRGCKIDFGKGERMEFKSVFIESQNTSKPLVLDIEYYLRTPITTIFSRFIASDDAFNDNPEYQMNYKHDYSVKPVIKSSLNLRDEDFGVFDAKSNERAVEYLGKYFDDLAKTYIPNDDSADRDAGIELKSEFRQCSKRIRIRAVQRFGVVIGHFHDIALKDRCKRYDEIKILFDRNMNKFYNDKIETKTDKSVANEYADDYVKLATQLAGNDKNRLCNTFMRLSGKQDIHIRPLNGVYYMHNALAYSKSALLTNFNKRVDDVMKMADEYNMKFNAFITDHRKSNRTIESVDDDTVDRFMSFDDFQIQPIKDLKSASVDLISVDILQTFMGSLNSRAQEMLKSTHDYAREYEKSAEQKTRQNFTQS